MSWFLTILLSLTILLPSFSIDQCYDVSVYLSCSVSCVLSTWKFTSLFSLPEPEYCNCWQWLYCLAGWMLWLVDSLYCHAPTLFCSPSASAHDYFTDGKTHNFTGLAGTFKTQSWPTRCERGGKGEVESRLKKFGFSTEEISHEHKIKSFRCVHLEKLFSSNHSI